MTEAVFNAHLGIMEDTGLKGLVELRRLIDRDKNLRMPSGDIALTASEHARLINAVDEHEDQLRKEAKARQNQKSQKTLF